MFYNCRSWSKASLSCVAAAVGLLSVWSDRRRLTINTADRDSRGPRKECVFARAFACVRASCFARGGVPPLATSKRTAVLDD